MALRLLHIAEVGLRDKDLARMVTFLPDRRNFFGRTRASSTLRMVRQAVASLTP